MKYGSMKINPKILVSKHRCGTAWVMQYMEEWNKTFCDVDVINPHEFMNPIVNTHMTPQDRIKFLEDKSKRGYNYSIKWLIQHINDYDLQEWFKEFYEGWEVIVLKRRDILRQVLSTSIAFEHAIVPVHVRAERNIEVPEHDKVIVSKDIVLRQLDYCKQLEAFEGDTTWYYEDLTDDFLSDYFHVNKIDWVKKQDHINYEDYVYNIDDVKGWINV